MSRFRIFPEIPWLLVGIATLAILASGWARPCWAEDRPVIENSIGMKLVSIPAGEFLMGETEAVINGSIKVQKAHLEEAKKSGDQEWISRGSSFLELLESQRPQHRVILTRTFFLGKYDVTQKEFSAVMGFNPSGYSTNRRLKELGGQIDTSRYPVEAVKWDDAVEFCHQLSALPEEVAAGRIYRLPTEAEWEYACRAGSNTKYYWGDTVKGPQGKTALLDDCTWFIGNSDLHPHPVGQKKPNTWGLFDMIGNVDQWCADWYDHNAYADTPLRDPMGPSSGTERIIRGSQYHANSDSARSASRGKHLPKRSGWDIGFRVACDVTTPVPQVVATVAEPTAAQDAQARLKEKGLTRRIGFLLLPEEAQFIRYCTTIERLRVACFHAQKECQDAQRQLSRVQSAKAGAIQSRMQARSAIRYSDTWREHWAAVRASNQASDTMMLVDLSKEGVQKWQQDAQVDLDSAVELFAGQIDKLQKMYQKLQKDYAKLYEDKTVKHALAEMNSQGKMTYRIGPTPSAAAAMKKLEHEQGLLAQFKKQ